MKVPKDVRHSFRSSLPTSVIVHVSLISAPEAKQIHGLGLSVWDDNL